MEKGINNEHSCVDCGTQNCKYKNRTYPEFCLTTNLDESDRLWALEKYEESNNKAIMIASAEVEYEGYCKWTRVQEIMEFAHKINAKRIGIANCIGLINEARIFAKILRANGFEPFAVIVKLPGSLKRRSEYLLNVKILVLLCAILYYKPACSIKPTQI